MLTNVMSQYAHRALARNGAALGILGLLFIAAADVTVVSTLLPVIATAMGDRALFPWLMSIFMASMALSGMCAGALADRYGVRRMLVSAVLVFMAASALAGAAPNMHVLLAARMLQGVGAGMIIVLSYSSLALIYGMAEHTRVQTLISVTWGIAALLGPLLGMFIAHTFGWRFVFIVNIPIGLICLAVFACCVPTTLCASTLRPFDWRAQLAFAVFVFVLMLGISANSLRLHAQTLSLLAMAGLLSLWVLRRRIQQEPDVAPIPTAFFRTRSLATLVVVVPCASMGLYASITFLPMAIEQSSVDAGFMPVIIVAAAMSFVVASCLAGMLVRRWGYDRVIGAGALCMSLGSVLLACRIDSFIATIILAEWSIGFGMGLVAVAAVLFAQYAAPPGYLSTYTSAVQVLRNIGAALGINLFAAVQGMATTWIVTMPPQRAGFLLLAILFSLCAVLSRWLPRTAGIHCVEAITES
jgi:MFS family permease